MTTFATPFVRCGRFVLAFALSGALLACSTAPPRPEPVARGDYRGVAQQVEALIAQQMRAHDVAGLSIAIVDDQRIVWSHGAGWADAQAKKPATERTLYRVGSISKLFTNTAALQLVQQGRLALDAPIGNALPGFTIRSRYGDAPITARQLMTHHAGLPRDVSHGMFAHEVAPYRTLVAGLADADAAYPPGLLMSYSNVGLTVLGAAVEQLAGVPFETHLQRAVLDPLGMTGAAFATGIGTSTEMARGHHAGKPADEPALRDVPAGGLNASVLDIGRFLMMVFADGRSNGQAVLEPQMLAEMLRVQNADVPLDVGFRVGLGWMMSALGSDDIRGAGPVAHHGGATIYFRSQMYALPEHKLGVIVASNDDTASSVVDTVAKRALALALEAKTGIRQPGPVAPFEPSAGAWPPEALDAYVGEYTTVAGHVKVQRRGERLKAQLFGREVDLLPGDDGRLGLRYALLGFVPISLGELDRLELQLRRIDGRDVLVARIGVQEMLVGERLPPPDGTSAAGLTGRYEPRLDPGEHRWFEAARVYDEDGRTFIGMEVSTDGPPPRSVLRVIGDGEALLLGPLADGGEVLRWRIVDGQVRATASGYQFTAQPAKGR